MRFPLRTKPLPRPAGRAFPAGEHVPASAARQIFYRMINFSGSTGNLLTHRRSSTHGHSASRPERHHQPHLGLRSRQHGEAERPDQRREHRDGFRQRKAHADADARPCAERHVGEAVARLGGVGREPLRVEAVRLGPQRVMPVKRVDGHVDGVALLHRVLAEREVCKSPCAGSRRRAGRAAAPPARPGAYRRARRHARD